MKVTENGSLFLPEPDILCPGIEMFSAVRLGHEVIEMQDVKNAAGKLVCRIDTRMGIVEIIHKGCKTLIHFNPDGTVRVVNTETGQP